MRWSGLALVVVMAGAGCVLDDLDLEGRPCPCNDGYRCADAGTDGVCVREQDGGARDAATPDAGPGGVLFRDGFEDGLSAWFGDFETEGVTTVVDDPVHDGGGALEARTTAAGGLAAPVAVWPGSVSSGDLWARAWVLAPAGEDVSGLVPLSVGDTDSGYVHAWLGSGDRLALVVGTEIPPTVSLADETYPRGEWFCLRLRVRVSDDAGTADLYLGDGASPAATLDAVDTRPPRDFSTVLAGIPHAQPDQGPVRVLVDDVVVDTGEVSCAAP